MDAIRSHSLLASRAFESYAFFVWVFKSGKRSETFFLGTFRLRDAEVEDEADHE
jgi:hypothetical protein